MMRIYEIKQTKTGRIIGYARSFDQAKAIVKEDDPVARKISNADLDYLFSNGMNVHALEVKVDKEGIITLLNNLIWYLSDVVEPKPEPVEKPTEQLNEDKTIEWADRRRQELEGVGLSDAQVQIIREIYEAKTVSPTPDKPAGIIPATAYDGTGNGTCLHCNKQVGYVGGFPRVNPPESIQDN